MITVHSRPMSFTTFAATLLASLLVLASACSSGQSTVFTIKKGSHYSTPRSLYLACDTRSMSRTVIFSPTCLYKLGTADDADINKLFGWAVGTSSIRVGWNCKSAPDKGVDLYAYFHVGGVRWTPSSTESSKPTTPSLIARAIPVGQEVSVTIVNTGRTVAFYVKTATRSDSLIVGKAFNSGCGSYLWPYFGGTSTAPHDMSIIFK